VQTTEPGGESGRIAEPVNGGLELARQHGPELVEGAERLGVSTDQLVELIRVDIQASYRLDIGPQLLGGAGANAAFARGRRCGEAPASGLQCASLFVS
jgi:hypothetical protein